MATKKPHCTNAKHSQKYEYTCAYLYHLSSYPEVAFYDSDFHHDSKTLRRKNLGSDYKTLARHKCDTEAKLSFTSLAIQHKKIKNIEKN